MLQAIRRFLKKESGATMVEYALILLFVAVAAVVGVTALGGAVSDGLNSANDGFP